MNYYLLGVDIGGTFTDIVLTNQESAQSTTFKVLTTPDDPVIGVVRGISELLSRSGVEAGEIGRAVHATTLATNLILEERGEKVAYITTQGFGDLPIIGRDVRAGDARYDLYFEKPKPPIHSIFEVSERVSARGEILKPLSERALEDVADALAQSGVASAAVCLLNSYANPDHELAIERHLRARLPHLYVAASVKVWPQFREFDRAMTTIMSAYVGPVLGRYLGRLETALRDLGVKAPLQFMKSNGGIVAASHAVETAVYAVESGPAAGIVAAGYVGRQCGEAKIVAFDMGGTTAKAGLIQDGEPATTHEFCVGGDSSHSSHGSGGFPIQIPVIDLAEVGSGGGSIAWIDDGGLLKVGPRSAGAQPGPACYGGGGQAATVTDADLALGYLSADDFAGGAMTISPVLAKEAIDKLAAQLSLSPLAVATGIHDIANANMAAAIRRVTIERGIDPRGFTAVASGGAGPVHIARVASEFSIPRIIIPRHAGVASATGLLESDVVIDGVRSFVAPTLESAPGKLNACFEELERSGWNEIEGHGVPRNLVTVLRTIELRYRHQAHGLPVPVATAAITADTIVRLPAAFNEIHRTRFGIASDEPTEIMAVKVRMVGAVLKAVERQRKCRPSDGASALVAWRPAYFTEFAGYVDTPVYDRLRLESGDAFNGPALIQDTGATIVVPPGHTVAVDGYCNIIIEPTAGGTAFTASRPVEADRVLPSRNTVEAGANSPALGETGGG